MQAAGEELKGRWEAEEGSSWMDIGRSDGATSGRRRGRPAGTTELQVRVRNVKGLGGRGHKPLAARATSDRALNPLDSRPYPSLPRSPLPSYLPAAGQPPRAFQRPSTSPRPAVLAWPPLPQAPAATCRPLSRSHDQPPSSPTPFPPSPVGLGLCAQLCIVVRPTLAYRPFVEVHVSGADHAIATPALPWLRLSQSACSPSSHELDLWCLAAVSATALRATPLEHQ